MKYPKEYIEEIKNRLKVSSVIGKTVSLKKRGKEFIGLSPFNSEKTPSFTVNDEKGFYHCFSSSEHGNIFDFLMKTQNLNFGEAVRMLASEAGMPKYTFSKLDEERDKKWKIYSKILNEYKIYYHNELKNNQGPNLKEYISKRGIDYKQMNNFCIGFVPKDPTFYNNALKNYSEKDLLDSGLFYFDEKNKKYVERFRDRLIFPINALNGSTIGFGGRIISNKNIFAKYINSPETIFFKKGNNLFNLDVARKHSNKSNEVYLVEGYMDVLSLTKFDIFNVVANLGTALTEAQIQMLWRFYNNIIICFDGDEGGKKAAIRAADKLIEIIKPDFNISFLFLPDNHDPDSFINSNGKEEFLLYANNKVSIHEFIWNHYSQNINTKEPSSMANFEKNLKEKFSSIKNEIVKKYMMEFFYQKISDFTPIFSYKNQKKKFISPSKPLRQTKEIFSKNKNYQKIELKEFSILYLILNNINTFQKNFQLLSKIKFNSSICKEFLELLINYFENTELQSLNFQDTDFVKNKYSKFINKINELTPNKFIIDTKKNEEDVLTIFEELLDEINKYDIDKKIDHLEKKLINNMNEKTYQELIDLKKQANGA